MNYLHSFFFSIKKLFSPKKSTVELDEELQFHLDMSIEQKLAMGMTQEQAEKEARKEFGSDLRVREACRMSWGARIVDETVQDIRRATRRLWNRPAYSVPIVVILAVALGVCATFADILYQRAFRPYPEADKVIEIGWSHPMPRFSHYYLSVSVAAFECLEEMTGVFESIGQCGSDGYFLKIGEETEFVHVAWMTTGTWNAIRLNPLYGRAFSQQDIDEGNIDVAVLTYRFAQKRFSAASDALGQDIQLNGKYFRVIGVLGKGIRFPVSSDICIPFRVDSSGRYGASNMSRGRVYGRLAEGVSMEQLQARLPSVMERVKEVDQYFQSYYKRYAIHFKARHYLDSFRVRYYKLGFFDLIYILTTLALFLFLIANMNWLSVLRTNMIRDMRNTGIHFALGAPKFRMFRSLCMENVLLMAVALLAGFLMSSVLHYVINQWRLFEHYPILQHACGYYVMTLLIVISLLLCFPLILHYLQTRNVQKYLQERQSTSSAGSKSLFTLSLAQTFFSTVLLLTSIFLALNITRILNADFGFRWENRLVAAVQIPTWRQQLSVDQKLQLLKSLKQRVSKIPGFETVSFSSNLPQGHVISQSHYFSTDSGKFPQIPEGITEDSGNRLRFSVNVADEDFKEAMGIQLLAGRWFQPSDALTEIIEVVIEKQVAEQLFGDQNPVGFQFVNENRNGELGKPFQIVGVVNDVMYGRSQLRVDLSSFNVYLYYAESDEYTSWPRDYCLVCKARDLNVNHFEDLRSAIQEVDSDLGLKMRFYRDDIKDSYDTILVLSRVALAMSVVTLVVTGYGFFSFLYYKTQLMTKEFAIRLALGGRRSRIIRRYMLKQSIPVLIGTLLGICALIGLMGVFAKLLSEVSRYEVFPYAIVVIGMIGFVGISSLFPLWQMRKLELRELLQNE